MLFGFITGASCFLAGFLWNRLDLSWVMLPLLAVGFFLGLFLLFFVTLVILCALVDMKKPQEHDSPFYRKLMMVCIEALVAALQVRIRVQGREKLPKEGRFLLVCNHQHIGDPGVIHMAFPNSQLAFVGKKESADMFLINKLMHRTMCQFIDRENDRQALKTILKCIQILKDDEVSVGVFPEGGIKDIGKLAHFRPGVFKIAQKANVPIVVCTMKGSEAILRNGLRLKPTHVELNLLDVIPAEDLKGRTTVDVADQVYEMMIADLGEEYRPEITP